MSKKQFDQKQKLAIVKSSEKLGVREAARIGGIHYTTLYDWRNKLAALGENAFLEYKPSIPGRGKKTISKKNEKSILRIWEDNPGFGPGQVRNQLRRQGITISIRTIREIMTANGYKAPGKKQDKEADTRFEARRPLELAQMDILEFYINKLKVYLILMLDDFSRFILGWRLLEETSIDSVIGVVTEAIDQYGKMEEILTDRGFVFYSWRGVNRFERFLELQGIDNTHARAHHPQTLGKVEACNRRLKAELIDQHHFAGTFDCQKAIEKWVDHYNYERSHQGIGGFLVPAERFHGQWRRVLKSMDEGVDITEEKHYMDMDRVIASLCMGKDGKMTIHIMGRPIEIRGWKNE
jgi:transposase InsO family protein